MHPFLFAVVVGILFLRASLSFGASFFCDLPGTTQEKQICADPTLSSLDSELGGIFYIALAIAPNPIQLRGQQKSWLSNSRNPCPTALCMKTAYEVRLKELHAIVDKHLVVFPSSLSVLKNYGTSKSPYCQASGSESYFSIAALSVGSDVKVNLDGVHDCGRKVWGPAEGTGRIRGKLAVVDFRGGFGDEKATGKAFLAVSGKNVVWKVFERVNSESYVPTEQVFRLTSQPSRAAGAAR